VSISAFYFEGSDGKIKDFARAKCLLPPDRRRFACVLVSGRQTQSNALRTCFKSSPS